MGEFEKSLAILSHSILAILKDYLKVKLKIHLPELILIHNIVEILHIIY